MDTFVNPLKNSVKNMGNMVKSVPDNFVDGMIKFSGGVKGLPSNVIDGVGKMLNVKPVSMGVGIRPQFCLLEKEYP